MDIQYYKEYSNELGRDMEFKSYGWGGIPLLAVPCQNGRFFDWEGFGMLDTLGDYLDQGRIRLFSFDTIDQETVSDVNGNPYDRVRRHEAWYRYVCNELVPRIHEISGWNDRILISGFSMGAYHAGNFMFRRPDIFRGCIALSGLYDTNDMYNGYMDEVKVPVVADIVHADDVRMRQTGAGLRLATEFRHEILIPGKFRLKNLNRHKTV